MKIYQVDAFAERIFTGNPAGVCILEEAADERTMLAPGAGISEDPVTGSAHCCLGPYWKRRLGKNKMNTYQASKRGGALQVTVDGGRVYIGGKAVTVFCSILWCEKSILSGETSY